MENTQFETFPEDGVYAQAHYELPYPIAVNDAFIIFWLGFSVKVLKDSNTIKVVFIKKQNDLNYSLDLSECTDVIQRQSDKEMLKFIHDNFQYNSMVEFAIAQHVLNLVNESFAS